MRRFALFTAFLLTACGHTHGRAFTYSDDASLPPASFENIDRVVAHLRLQHPASIHVRQRGGSILLRWLQVRTPVINLATVAPGRIVYAIDLTFDHPFAVGGNRYRSGRQTLIVDALTGTGLICETRGLLVTRADSFIRATSQP